VIVSYLAYLVRHAPAEDSAEIPDATRGLTPSGAEKMRRVARGLAAIGVEPAAIYSSPLRRAVETAQLIVEELAPALRVEQCDALAPGHTSDEMIEMIAGLASVTLPHMVSSTPAGIFLVGHEPSLGFLASHLITGSPDAMEAKFKKGGVMAIEVAPSANGGLTGRAKWMMTPSHLSRLAEAGPKVDPD
jgi:phosphohistidine phosphatase